jgi:hypothetical protein
MMRLYGIHREAGAVARLGYPASRLEDSTGGFTQSLRGPDRPRLGRDGTDPPISRRPAIYTTYLSLSNRQDDI